MPFVLISKALWVLGTTSTCSHTNSRLSFHVARAEWSSSEVHQHLLIASQFRFNEFLIALQKDLRI